MIAAWMLYCVAIAVLFVVVGEALERSLHLAGRATRWAWVAALAGSYLVPAAAWLRPSAFGALPVSLAQPVVAGLQATAGPSDPQHGGGAPPTSVPSFSLGDLDAALTWTWGFSAAALVFALSAAALRLAALRRGWRNATVDGRAVLVSDNVGPAVAGLWRPRVVLPEWAVRLGDRERRLMLAHEDEHIRARDPWLLAAAAVTLCFTPWNPVAWWQVRRLRLAVEMDCDARVVARDGDAPAYGALLLRVGQRRARLPLGAPALGEPVSFLGRRIRRMATALPRWRWPGAIAATLVAVAAAIAACEAPRPVGPKAASERSAVVDPDLGATQHQPPASPPYFPANLRSFAHQYYPGVFAHPLPGAAVAFVFDAQDSMVGQAAGVREARDADCLAVVDRLLPAFHTSKWFLSGCAEVADKGTVVVYWKSLRHQSPVAPERGPTEDQAPTAQAHTPDGTDKLRRLAHQYHPEVFAHPLPSPAVGGLDPRNRLGIGHAAIAFVLDKRGRVVGHAAGVREAGDDGCLGVVDRLVPAFRASKWHSSGCADAGDKGAAVIYWKLLQQVQGSDDVLNESMVDEQPVFLSGPPLQYPNLLRQAGIQGRVMVRAIIDTTGRAEPGSVRVIESPHPGFDQAARNFVLRTRFRPGRVHGRAVRVLIEFPVEFRTRG